MFIFQAVFLLDILFFIFGFLSSYVFLVNMNEAFFHHHFSKTSSTHPCVPFPAFGRPWDTHSTRPHGFLSSVRVSDHLCHSSFFKKG
ncbi:hypothetical protein B0T19DRAFT_83418 [Cercophora scortea]|uniref:Uncharacterized protein n=1 Tax=Cercophora scortea TaxID=314031 RepID=A0AAE0IW09_9PEZI|nr:hypothetical protein B0T19DRAFT_83418 [Cercophora scortea]